jgi:hypothetical protein
MFLESDGFLALSDQVMMIRRTRTLSVRSVPSCFFSTGGCCGRGNSHQKGTYFYSRLSQRSLNSMMQIIICSAPTKQVK